MRTICVAMILCMAVLWSCAPAPRRKDPRLENVIVDAGKESVTKEADREPAPESGWEPAVCRRKGCACLRGWECNPGLYCDETEKVCKEPECLEDRDCPTGQKCFLQVCLP